MDDQGDVRVSKVFVGVFVSISLSVIGSAAKAYMDVAELKVKVNNYADNQKYLREDIKEIKEDIKQLLKSQGG
jgi:chaperonin cofactor prefoldin